MPRSSIDSGRAGGGGLATTGWERGRAAAGAGLSRAPRSSTSTAGPSGPRRAVATGATHGSAGTCAMPICRFRGPAGRGQPDQPQRVGAAHPRLTRLPRRLTAGNGRLALDAIVRASRRAAIRRRVPMGSSRCPSSRRTRSHPGVVRAAGCGHAGRDHCAGPPTPWKVTAT